MLTINEIFHSIQGESTHTGRPCVFVRLTACDLRCSWCDTPYAFTEGRKMTIEDVVGRVNAYGCDTVEITGGEPLLQADVYPLMERLLEQGHTVMLETGGHRSIAAVPPGVIRIVDVKCPASGESERNDWSNLELITTKDEVKFVIGDRADYEWSREVIERYELIRRCPVLLQPVTNDEAVAATLQLAKGNLAPVELASWILEDRLEVRLSLQLHKLIWSPAARGV